MPVPSRFSTSASMIGTRRAAPGAPSQCCAPGCFRERRGACDPTDLRGLLDVAGGADFLDRRDAGEDLVDAVLAQRAHAFLHRGALDRLAPGAVLDHPAQLARDHHHLVDAGTALEAGVVA